MSYVRTPEHRKQQAERIHTWSPWEQSTGPRSPEGKATSAMNAWKGGHREILRELARVLEGHRRTLLGVDS